MSKKKKQWILLLSLSIIVAGLVVAYMFIPEGKTSEDETENSQAVTVATFDAESIVKIDVQSVENTISLEKENNSWYWLQKKEVPLNTEAIDKLIKALESIEATQELVYHEEQREDYGLKTPSLIVSITENDGKETVLELGEAVPAVGGYYSTINSKTGKLYSLPETFYDTFLMDEKELYQRDEVPTIKADYVTGITIDTGKKGNVFVAGEVSKKKQIERYSNWNIEKSYKVPVAVNPSKISTLQAAYSAITLGSLVEYQPKEDKKYGFSGEYSKVKINYFDLKEGASESKKKGTNGEEVTYVKKGDRVNKTFVLEIGKQMDEDNYYVRIKDVPNIYQMSKSEIVKLTEPDPFEYADHSVYATIVTKIKGYDITIGKKKIQIRRKANGEKNIWYLNGKQVKEEDEEEFLKPYSAMFLLEYSSIIKPEVKPESNKPVMKITYHEEDKDITVDYLPYDGTNFYRVKKNGEQIFLSNMRPVNDVISKFKKMIKTLEQ